MANGEVTTTELLEFLQENMLTKEDGGAFATKEDLKAFATKEDLTRGLNRQKLEILDAVDDKLADLKGDLVVLMRKEDTKVVNLISLLKDKAVITEEEAGKLLSLEPFPQLQR